MQHFFTLRKFYWVRKRLMSILESVCKKAPIFAKDRMPG